LRHYLVLVVNPRHRKAITRLLVSQHPLAVECLRYKKQYHKEIVPRNLRRCRFGCVSVETVEHAMFFCDQMDELIQRRTTFVLAMSARLPEILVVSTATATAVLRSLVFNRDAVCQVAKFAHYVFGVSADTALVWPEGY
ncbi:hypothetical protein DFH08DRAFT_725343, partial [Mycena albidolilacea]